MRSAEEIQKRMRIGWNLGNSFDCFVRPGSDGGETGWGNPVTTKEMIDEIAKKGFNVLRIPVTWFEAVDDGNGFTISEKKLERVKEVVNWAIENEMFVIINAHHENSWMVPRWDCFERVKEKYVRIWEQIAGYFRDYPDLLLFEAMNEPRIEWGENEWGGAVKEVRDVINALESEFVKTVRNSGGNNAGRCILVTTAGAAATELAIGGLAVPKDPNIMVSLHPYLPHEFCYEHEGGDNVRIWDRSLNYVLDETFERIDRMLLQKGIPALVTEFGAVDKDNEEEVMKWAEYYLEAAGRHNIRCIWWDNNSQEPGDSFAIFKREELRWVRPGVVNVLVR